MRHRERIFDTHGGFGALRDPEEDRERSAPLRRPIRIPLELARARVSRREHFRDPPEEGGQNRGHERLEVFAVEILERGRERVLLVEEASGEYAQRLPGGAASVARNRARLRHDPGAEDPLSPPEVHVLEVGEVVVVEAARPEERVAPNGHETPRREEPLLAGRRLLQARERPPDLVGEGVAVERQEAVGEVIPAPLAIRQSTGDGRDVGRRAVERGSERRKSGGLDDRVVVDEGDRGSARGLRPQSAPRGEADVSGGGDEPHSREAPRDLREVRPGRVVDEKRLDLRSRRGGFDPGEALEQVV
jgi:hypothetical protein